MKQKELQDYLDSIGLSIKLFDFEVDRLGRLTYFSSSGEIPGWKMRVNWWLRTGDSEAGHWWDSYRINKRQRDFWENSSGEILSLNKWVFQNVELICSVFLKGNPPSQSDWQIQEDLEGKFENVISLPRKSKK